MTIVTDGPQKLGQTSRPAQSSPLRRCVGHADKIALVAVASFYLITCLIIVFKRLPFPFELEWMEGASVLQVQRILDHEPLYTAPSIHFVPLIYNPFYFYVSALLATFTGNDFLPLRLVSVLSSVGCFALIFKFVYRRTTSHFASWIATC